MPSPSMVDRPPKRVKQSNVFHPLHDPDMFDHISNHLDPMEGRSMALTCKKFLNRMPGFSNMRFNDYVQQELSHPNLPLHRQSMLLNSLKVSSFSTLDLPEDKDWIQQSFDLQQGEIAFELLLRGIRPRHPTSIWIECLKRGYIELADWMLEESVVSAETLQPYSHILRDLIPSFIQREAHVYYQKTSTHVTEDLALILEYFLTHVHYPVDAFLDLIFENNFFTVLKTMADVLQMLGAEPGIYQRSSQFLDRLTEVLGQSRPNTELYQDLVESLKCYFNDPSNQAHVNLLHSVHEIQQRHLPALQSMAHSDIQPLLTFYPQIHWNLLPFSTQWQIICSPLEDPAQFYLSFYSWLGGLHLNPNEQSRIGSLLKLRLSKYLRAMLKNMDTLTDLVYLVWQWTFEPKRTTMLIHFLLDEFQVHVFGGKVFVAFLAFFISESTDKGQYQLPDKQLNNLKGYLNRAHVERDDQFWSDLEDSVELVCEGADHLDRVLAQLIELRDAWAV
jgi:hypothetical protein